MGIRVFIVYLLLISKSMFAGINVTEQGYRNLECLISPNFCENIIYLDGCLSKTIITSDELNKMRAKFLREKLFDILYSNIKDQLTDELEAKFKTDLVLGYVWVEKNGSVFNEEDYLNIAFEMGERTKYSWNVDINDLEKKKINNIVFPDNENIKYGNINVGYAVYVYNNVKDLELKDGYTNIIITFEFVGGTFEIREGNLFFPITYLPVIRMESK